MAGASCVEALNDAQVRSSDGAPDMTSRGSIRS
ncbi:MAG: hypothetical protein QOE65_2472 [Solirubrobacteraceae bacterium]|jgi:hypothetical protein|nr:hypothetical protein [Solirubrobacteraceae bacterium]